MKWSHFYALSVFIFLMIGNAIFPITVFTVLLQRQEWSFKIILEDVKRKEVALSIPSSMWSFKFSFVATPKWTCKTSQTRLQIVYNAYKPNLRTTWFLPILNKSISKSMFFWFTSCLSCYGKPIRLTIFQYQMRAEFVHSSENSKDDCLTKIVALDLVDLPIISNTHLWRRKQSLRFVYTTLFWKPTVDGMWGFKCETASTSSFTVALFSFS